MSPPRVTVPCHGLRYYAEKKAFIEKELAQRPLSKLLGKKATKSYAHERAEAVLLKKVDRLRRKCACGRQRDRHVTVVCSSRPTAREASASPA